MQQRGKLPHGQFHSSLTFTMKGIFCMSLCMSRAWSAKLSWFDDEPNYIWKRKKMDTFLLFTYGTYSMEQSPSWESNRFSASQEIPEFYGTLRFITAFTGALHLFLSWASWLRIGTHLSEMLLEIHFPNIVPICLQTELPSPFLYNVLSYFGLFVFIRLNFVLGLESHCWDQEISAGKYLGKHSYRQ